MRRGRRRRRRKRNGGGKGGGAKRGRGRESGLRSERQGGGETRGTCLLGTARGLLIWLRGGGGGGGGGVAFSLSKV